MVKLIEMDERVSLRTQMQEEGGAPVVLINKFNVPPEGVDQFLQTWEADAAFLKTQPGYISAQLHRGISGSCTFVNIAFWESVDAFRRAFSQPEFQAKMAVYPEGVSASPHLFRKVAVSGICVT
jgi:heme-degrading monooxygenase HmoA